MIYLHMENCKGSFLFSASRSFHLATGTAFIAVANFVDQLVEVQTKGMTMMNLLSQNYSHANYVRKNVCPLHIYILLLSRHSFRKWSSSSFSLIDMNTIFFFFFNLL